MSCNQLVRQLVPVLIDATMASLDEQHVSVAQRQEAVQQLLQHRLAANVARAMHWPPSARHELHTLQGQVTQPCAARVLGDAAAQQASELVTAPILQRQVQPASSLRTTWDAARLQAAGGHGLLLLVTAAPPCSHWAVRATLQDGSIQALAALSAPLPPLVPALQSRWVPRHWAEVMRGVDWQHNATRLLYVPFAGHGKAGPQQQPLARLDVVILGSRGGGTALLAQVLHRHPLEQAEQDPATDSRQQELRLLQPGQAASLQAPHPAALPLTLPRHTWPLSSAACGAGRGASLPCLAVLLLGSSPPWALHIQQHSTPVGNRQRERGGSTSSEQRPGILPAVIGVRAGAGAADSVRVASLGKPAGSGASAVPLWDGVGPADRLLLISDPHCTYRLR